MEFEEAKATTSATRSEHTSRGQRDPECPQNPQRTASARLKNVTAAAAQDLSRSTMNTGGGDICSHNQTTGNAIVYVNVHVLPPAAEKYIERAIHDTIPAPTPGYINYSVVIHKIPLNSNDPAPSDWHKRLLSDLRRHNGMQSLRFDEINSVRCLSKGGKAPAQGEVSLKVSFENQIDASHLLRHGAYVLGTRCTTSQYIPRKAGKLRSGWSRFRSW